MAHLDVNKRLISLRWLGNRPWRQKDHLPLTLMQEVHNSGGETNQCYTPSSSLESD